MNDIDRNNFDEVTVRLCEMVSDVGRRVFDNEHAHDCFCGESVAPTQFYSMVSGLILDWIEEAVEGAVLSHEKQEKAAL